MNIALSIQYFPRKTFSSLKNLPDSKIFVFFYKTGGADCPLGDSRHYLKISPFIFRQEVTDWGWLTIGWFAVWLQNSSLWLANSLPNRYCVMPDISFCSNPTMECYHLVHVFSNVFHWTDIKSKSAQFCLIFRVNESTQCNIEK